MTKTEIDQALVASSSDVLETMFFSEANPANEGEHLHEDPIVCLLQCSGAAEGTFSIAVDRASLQALCVSFYGEDDANSVRQEELACELTNMVAGSTLSRLVPEKYCALTAPQLCSFERHQMLGKSCADSTSVLMHVEGGLLSAACCLRME